MAAFFRSTLPKLKANETRPFSFFHLGLEIYPENLDFGDDMQYMKIE
jgi:hypothetical protein